jgi:inner membrane protein
MDSLTQIALGASVSETVMQNKVGRKASLWGAICGTLPDLDVFIPMGNAIKEFTYHRAESHAFFYMALATPILVWLILKIHLRTKEYKIRWLIAVFLTFITHSILDGLTAYGTQMLLPFSNNPISWNTIFVVDPLYTLPLLLGLVTLLFKRKNPVHAMRSLWIGIAFSSIYLIWSIGAKLHIQSVAENSLSNQNITVTQTLVGPSPFNTVLWRVVGKTEDGYVEGFYSLFDESDDIRFTSHTSENELIIPLADSWSVQRLKWFTKGFYEVNRRDQKIVVTDIRMGMSGLYFFSFIVGERTREGILPVEAVRVEPEEFSGVDPLRTLWQRIWDEGVEM